MTTAIWNWKTVVNIFSLNLTDAVQTKLEHLVKKRDVYGIVSYKYDILTNPERYKKYLPYILDIVFEVDFEWFINNFNNIRVYCDELNSEVHMLCYYIINHTKFKNYSKISLHLLVHYIQLYYGCETDTIAQTEMKDIMRMSVVMMCFKYQPPNMDFIIDAMSYSDINRCTYGGSVVTIAIEAGSYEWLLKNFKKVECCMVFPINKFNYAFSGETIVTLLLKMECMKGPETNPGKVFLNKVINKGGETMANHYGSPQLKHPLTIAIDNRVDLNIIRCLLRNGANPNSYSKVNCPTCVLSHAITNYCLHAAKLLLEYGAHPGGIENKWETLKHACKIKNSIEKIKYVSLLLQYRRKSNVPQDVENLMLIEIVGKKCKDDQTRNKLVKLIVETKPKEVWSRGVKM